MINVFQSEGICKLHHPVFIKVFEVCIAFDHVLQHTVSGGRKPFSKDGLKNPFKFCANMEITFWCMSSVTFAGFLSPDCVLYLMHWMLAFSPTSDIVYKKTGWKWNVGQKNKIVSNPLGTKSVLLLIYRDTLFDSNIKHSIVKCLFMLLFCLQFDWFRIYVYIKTMFLFLFTVVWFSILCPIHDLKLGISKSCSLAKREGKCKDEPVNEQL